MEPQRIQEADSGIRYQADERPPIILTAGLGLQLSVLILVGAALVPTIIFRSAGASDPVLSWAVFASLVLCGLTTAAQAFRFGAGFNVVTIGSGAAIAVSIEAVSEGGAALLALLVIISSVLQFAIAARLSLFRRFLTPAIAGTVVMLIPVSVMPVVLSMLDHVPTDANPASIVTVTLVTLLAIAGITLNGGPTVRLWAPVIGVCAGALCAVPFGLYDLDRVSDASWIGFPQAQFPGLDLGFEPAFWALLPAFLLVTLISTVQSVSSVVAIQRVSWRRSRAANYRSVQNSVALEGVGNLLCGFAGTLPNASRSSGATIAEITGVASRHLGISIGVWIVVFAFLPKVTALVMAIPGPVIAAYVATLMAVLFMIGVKLVMQDGLDYRKSLIVGISFWIGVACQYDLVFPELIAVFAGGLLENGMTSGGIAVILLSLFVELTRSRPSRFETEFTLASLPELREFLIRFAKRSGWDGAMADRLDAASEETLLTLMQEDDADAGAALRRLRVTARKDGRVARLEFLVSAGDENIQDRITLLGDDSGEIPVDRDISLRLLRHLASSVHHQQYHGMDVVTLHVEVPRVAHSGGVARPSP